MVSYQYLYYHFAITALKTKINAPKKRKEEENL